MRKKIPSSYDSGNNLSSINNNSLGKGMVSDHTIGSKLVNNSSINNQYKYSKEEVLSLWNKKKTKKIPFDYESNKNIASTEPLIPMSMISLNSLEKKVTKKNKIKLFIKFFFYYFKNLNLF